MIKVENYPNAYREVYEILMCMSEEDVQKIPNEFMNMVKNNMNKDYEFHVTEGIDFEEQQILKETKVILAYIFLHYWATEEQKEKVKKKFRQDIIDEEEERREKYNPDNLFLNNNNQNTEKEENSLIEYKLQNIFAKIINIIKGWFRRKE